MTSRQLCIKRGHRYNIDLSTNRTNAKIINFLTKQGKKQVAEKVLYDCIQKIKNVGHNNVDTFIQQAVTNITPLFKSKATRVGGSVQQIPILLEPAKAESLAIKWLVDTARKRSERGMSNKLLNELKEAFNNKGNAVKKRMDLIVQIESSRSFSHFQK